MSIQSLFGPSLFPIPEGYRRLSFSSIGLLWIASNSYLCPTKCKIEEIKDHNDLELSLKESGIDMRRYEIKSIGVTGKGGSDFMRKALRECLTHGTHLFASPIGVLWHTSCCTYYLALSILNRETHSLLTEHWNSLTTDLKFSGVTWVGLGVIAIVFLIPLAAFYLNFTQQELDLDLLGVALGTSIFPITLIAGLYNLINESSMEKTFKAFFDDTDIPYATAIFLRNEFGIVGEKGWLLTPQIKVEVENGNLKKNYLINLFIEQAVEVLQECHAIATLKQINLVEQLPHFTLLPYLENPALYLHFHEALQSGNYLQKLKEDLNRYELFKQLIESFGHGKVAKFPFKPDDVKKFFIPDAPKSDSLAQELLITLENFKKIHFPLNLKESPQLFELVKRLRKAHTAYDVLGIKEGEPHKNAYKKASLIAHPDRYMGKPSWNTANETFKLISAANQYLEEAQST